MSHARRAPSAFKSYEACPSYIPDAETTKAAERGTTLHKILEGTLKRCDTDLTEQDEHQLEMVSNYTAPLLSGAQTSKSKVYRELELDLRPLGIIDCTHGTVDLLIASRKSRTAELIDYKFGWLEVDDAECNIQLAIYALGVFEKLSYVDTINVHILQPARDEVSTCTIHRSSPIRTLMLLRAKTIAERILKYEGKTFNPTLDHCIWCDRKADCKALQNFALRVRDLAGFNSETFQDLTPDSFQNLAQSGDVYEFASILEKWANAIKYKITRLAQDGSDIPGHDLREVNGKRSVVDQHGTFELLKKQFKVSLAEYLAACEPSLTRIFETVRSKAPRGDKDKREREASDVLMDEGMITQGNPSAYLVRIRKPKEN